MNKGDTLRCEAIRFSAFLIEQGRFVRGWLICLCVVALPATAQADVLADRAKLDAQYRTQLAALADATAQAGLMNEAQRTREWSQPTPRFAVDVAVVPAAADPPVPADAPAALREWQQKFLALRHAQADALFALAKQALQEKRRSLAWLWAHETLRENPDHAAARWTLGYQQHQGRWLTTFELTKAKSGQVWSDKFGWLPQDELVRYEQGERLFRGKWISAAKDAEERTNMDRGWEMTTEHFVIRTNHSLEAAAELALELEKLSRVWHALFITFLASERDMTLWFDGKLAPRRAVPRHQIWCFRDQQEYHTALKDEQPWIANTTGYYNNDLRRAYLFYGLKDRSNLYHEATHQLFAERRMGRTPVAHKGNFWIVEGIACYMESLVEHNGFYRVGGLKAVRLNDARIRLLRDQFYEPFSALVTMGMLSFQKHADIRKLYSQTAGQTYFLLEHRHGAYRDAAVDYLTRIYNNRDNSATLTDLTERDLPTLDREYREFLLEVQAAAD